MAFLVQCAHRGCMKMQEALLDVKNDVVVCSECRNEIQNITTFTKRQMKSMGQILTSKGKQQAYAFLCSSCKEKEVPINVDNVLCCNSCKKPLDNMSKAFENLVKDFLKKPKEEI